MQPQRSLLCILAGLLISAALLLALASSAVNRPAAATEATPVPRIILEFVGTHPDGLDLV